MSNDTKFTASPNWQTLANLEIINDMSVADLGVTDVLLAGTIWQRLFVQGSSNGTKHEYEKEVEAPTVGFREINDGHINTAGVDELVTVNLKPMEVTTEADMLLVEAWAKRPGGREGYMAKKSMRKMKAAFHTTSRQTIYGGGNDLKGFAGLVDSPLLNSIGSDNVIDAGGTGNNLFSVYLVRTDEDGVSAIYNDDSLFQFGEIYQQQLSRLRDDGAGGQDLVSFAAYVQTTCAWLALQIGGKFDVHRVVNIDASDFANIEDHIQDAIALAPDDRKPNDIWAPRAVKRAIQKGRQKRSDDSNTVGMAADVDGIALTTCEALTAETQLTT